MSTNTEARRKAQKKYAERMYNNGYQRANVWMPESLLESIRKEALKKGMTLQEFIVLSLKQTMQNMWSLRINEFLILS